jgi:hypothetical protein
MSCDGCGSDRIVLIDAKCSDLCCIQYGGLELNGYPPRGLKIGGGDYINLSICYHCGKVQGIQGITDKEIRENFE